MSEARWGQHSLYTGKMQMYAALLGYDDEYVRRLQRFNKFQVIAAIYWFSVNDAPGSQATDLWMIRTLTAYKAIDKKVAEDCLKVAFNHLQFLAPEFCFLSLFSTAVATSEKAKIAAAIMKCPTPDADENGFKFEVKAPEPAVKITASTNLWDLAAGARVFLPFTLYGINWDFLKKDPTTLDTVIDIRCTRPYVCT